MKPQVHNLHYRQEYDSLERFVSYWAQIELIMRLQSFPILEVGIGNAFTRDYLRKQGIAIVGADIDPQLGPDCVASIFSLPFVDQSFGTVVACQVLEHLPFEKFRQSVLELARVSSEFIVLSLPNAGWQVSGAIRLPKVGRRTFVFDVARFVPKWKFRPNDQHFWEIGWWRFSARRVRKELDGCGLYVMDEFRVPDYPYHHFFVLRKKLP